MKKYLFILILTFLVLTCAAAQSSQTPQNAAEITFAFARQTGSASNQFAVWIENEQGIHIKTLYATRYTANGGWKVRASSIPTWVKQSGLANMTKPQVDALTSATPRAGDLSYTWDGTDSRGAAVPAGNYVLFLEATLRWENQAVYRAPIKLGQGAASAEVSVEYIGDGAVAERAMISAVKVRTLR